MLREVKVMEDAHVAVLLEQIRGQFKLFGESLQATNEKIDRRSAEMREALTGVEHRLDVRLTHVESRLINVEGRLINVEGRLTNVEGRLINVEGRLTNMAMALNGGAGLRKKTKK